MPDFKFQFKSLFDTPEKARITILCLLVAVATLGAVIAVCFLQSGPAADDPSAQSEAVSDAPADSESPSVSENPAESSGLAGLVPALTIDEARELVLLDAGVDEEEADISREALEQDNGVWVYAFQFRTERAQYSYKINANTGEVRTMIKETFAPPASEAAEPSMPSLPEESADPGESASPAGADPQPAPSPQSTQSTDPNPSQTSAPASPSTDPSPSPSQTALLYIGMSQAKSIALDHAGLSGAQVTITRERMTRDDGRVVYEIEFRRNGIEYEYEIDALSGAILEFEMDDD